MHERHDPSQRRLIWPPEPGFFRLRLCKGAWAVPSKIARLPEAQDWWQATIDEAVYPAHRDPVLAAGVPEVWQGGFIIEESEYLFLLAVKAHAAARGLTHHPSLNPYTPISAMRLEPIQP